MKTVVVLMLTCLIVNSGHAQGVAGTTNRKIDDLTGAWKFVVTDEADAPIATSYNVLKKQNNELVVSDLAWGTTAKAMVLNGSVKLPMTALLDSASRDRVTFTTDLPSITNAAGSWNGSAIVKNSRYKIQGVRLPSIWACSHKEPTHTAASTEEMQVQTKEHKCTGWHQVPVQ